jgi:hypothetical protein
MTAAQAAQQGERTISMDEMTGVQALERFHPDLPMTAGYVLRREFEYLRYRISKTRFSRFSAITT